MTLSENLTMLDDAQNVAYSIGAAHPEKGPP